MLLRSFLFSIHFYSEMYYLIFILKHYVIIVVIIIILQLALPLVCLPTAYQWIIYIFCYKCRFYLYIRLLLADLIRIFYDYSLCKISLILIKNVSFLFPFGTWRNHSGNDKEASSLGLTPTVLEGVRQAAMTEKQSKVLPSCKIYKPKNDQQGRVFSKVQ